MPARTCTLSALRSALNNLYDPRILKASPLLRALGVAPNADAPAWLRRALVQAIESLKPEDSVPPQSPAQRAYEILHYRYVEHCSLEEVANQLGLGVRQLKREQRRALELLAQRFSEQQGIQFDLSDSPRDPEAAAPDDGAKVASPADLQWLEDSPGGEPAELGTVIPAVLDLVQPIAARYSVRLRTATSSPLPLLAVDAVALRQLLLSLLCVAVRRSANGKLSLSAQAAGWHVEVQIQGSTLQPAGEPAPEDASNLATARQLAAACGADLVVTSATCPFAAMISLPAVEQVPVLVIDDNADTLHLLQRYAAHTRYRVLGAQNAEQALTLAQDVAPRAIVLDIMMPRVDGWELLRRLQRQPATSSIPVIACSILAQEELAVSLGVRCFLRKPVGRRAFLDALDALALVPAK